MQFLGVPPSAVVAVFAEVFDDQPHVLKMADACFRVTKPKAFGVTTHQCRSALAQLGRGRHGRRHFAKVIRLGSHVENLRTPRLLGKQSFSRGSKATARMLGHRFRRNVAAEVRAFKLDGLHGGVGGGLGGA